MRFTKSNAQISVKAISGLEVILLGLNVPDADKDRLLGFKILKVYGKDEYLLSDGRKFEGTEHSLIQDFLWGDYSVSPNKTYTYKISAVYGTPDNQEESEAIELQVKTEDPDHEEHAVFFNRGVAGSQAYSRKFDKYRRWFKTESLEEDSSKIRYKQFIKPEDVPNGEAYKWLSRGLEEALIAYISQAKDSSYSIRASLYELSYTPAAQAFVDALERGADVKIIHHAKRKTAYKLSRNFDADTSVTYDDGSDPQTFKSKELVKYKTLEPITTTAMQTVGKVGVRDEKNQRAFSKMLIQRTNTTISHNKFIILLKDGKPIEVWTGSTNLTYGGIFGQSNIGHIVRDENIAQQYFDYWTKLSEDPIKSKRGDDPEFTAMKNWVAEHNPNLNGVDPNSIHAIFSPRKDTDMLQWYADRMKNAKQSVFFTAAFSMDKRVLDILKNNTSTEGPFQRYLLLEGITGLMRDKYPILQKSTQNRISYGDEFKKRKGIEHTDIAIETLTGLNDHVNYIHTKYLVVDALTDDPLVVSGSANFSEASTINNDENMLIIRGNTRIADMFVCDFMRLFNHFKRRNDANKLSDAAFQAGEHLDSGSDWAAPFFEPKHQLEQQRLLFGTDVGNP
jgi:phosphatidylserine/phosphatidylglycerophosphate/cardiolipin synthase-like enzyme